MYRVKLGSRTFPVAPEHITCSHKSRNRTVDLLDGSQAVITREPSLRTYTLKLTLPAREYTFAVYEDGFVLPDVICGEIEALARERRTVDLTIERGRFSERAHVCVEDMTRAETAKDGEDVSLTLTLQEVSATARYGVYAVTSSYTVRTGDTLRSIAKRTLGDDTLWTKLYGANLSIIEAAAKANGFADSRLGERIFPGTVLTIPQGVNV